MADYWKSIDKKFCETCKCWITDNRSSIEFHESGRRHKENVRRRLEEIQKKASRQQKNDKRFDKDLAKIEKAAMASYFKDKEDNPDLSHQIRKDYEENREMYESIGIRLKEDIEKEKKKKEEEKDLQVKIAHRPESKKKESTSTTTQKSETSYNPYKGWKSLDSIETNPDLELPKSSNSNSISRKLGKRIRETEGETPSAFHFEQKRVVSLESAEEKAAGSSEVSFKKRKLGQKFNRRQRDEEDG